MKNQMKKLAGGLAAAFAPAQQEGGMIMLASDELDHPVEDYGGDAQSMAVLAPRSLLEKAAALSEAMAQLEGGGRLPVREIELDGQGCGADCLLLGTGAFDGEDGPALPGAAYTGFHALAANEGSEGAAQWSRLEGLEMEGGENGEQGQLYSGWFTIAVTARGVEFSCVETHVEEPVSFFAMRGEIEDLLEKTAPEEAEDDGPRP